MTAPGNGAITPLAVVSAFDDASRFRRSSSAGAWLVLTPRRYEADEISRNGRIRKRGDGFTRKCLYEAVNAIFCRNLGGPRLRTWVKVIAERTGPRKPMLHWPENWLSSFTPCDARILLSRGAHGLTRGTTLTLNQSATECFQPGHAARMRSLRAMRHRPMHTPSIT